MGRWNICPHCHVVQQSEEKCTTCGGVIEYADTHTVQPEEPKLPTDWKAYHTERLATLDETLRGEAVAMLREKLADILPQIKAKMDANPQEWWTPYHFYWGMAVRNLLRKEGFTDEKLGGNLDDYYVGLVEQAVGEGQ